MPSCLFIPCFVCILCSVPLFMRLRDWRVNKAGRIPQEIDSGVPAQANTAFVLRPKQIITFGFYYHRVCKLNNQTCWNIHMSMYSLPLCSQSLSQHCNVWLQGIWAFFHSCYNGCSVTSCVGEVWGLVRSCSTEVLPPRVCANEWDDELNESMSTKKKLYRFSVRLRKRADAGPVSEMNQLSSVSSVM